jgi:hypothetical protein
MIVTLDGQRLETDFAPGSSLQTLIDHLRGMQSDDRLVVSVAVNGHRYGERDLEDGLTQPLGANDQVDVESGNRCEVAAEALRGIAAQLADAESLQAEIAGQLNSGQVAEAVRRFGEFLQVWQACRTALVQGSGLVGRDLTGESFDGRAVQEYLAELADKLRELRGAFEARDMVLLADLIHYEMPALCQTWHNVLLSLAEGIEAGTDARA